MWFVYILQSKKDGTLYTGVTTDLGRRCRAHNGLIKGGAKRTRAGRPWELVYHECKFSRGGAQRREAEIKSMPRAWKLKLAGIV